MKKRIFLAFASVMMLVFFAGCGKVPQEQIDATNAAIQTAKAAEADLYVPAEFAALQDSMNVAMAEVEAIKSKTFKNFGKVTEKITAIAAMAATVTQNAAVAKEQVKISTEALFVEVDAVVVEHKALMLKAPKGKEGRAVLEVMKNEMVVIEGSVAEAKAMFEQGQFKAAFDKLTAAKENVIKINTELSDAIAKVKGGRK